MDKRVTIRRKNRLRLIFTVITLSMYFAFVLNWTPLGEPMLRGIGGSLVNGALAMFVLLVVSFILLELLFLRLAKTGEPDSERDK